MFRNTSYALSLSVTIRRESFMRVVQVCGEGCSHLGIQMTGVFVVVPHLAVVAIGEPEARHPVLASGIAPPLSNDSRDEGWGTHVKLKPLVRWKWGSNLGSSR